MTTIACWFNKESTSPSTWICGDSKVSTSGAKSISDSSPKIFSVPIQCYAPGPEGFFDSLCFRTSIGLAYSGNAIVGLTINSALSTCLSNLITASSPPALNDIADFSIKLLSLYVKQVSGISGDRALSEIALTGFCPIERRLKIYHIYPSLEDGMYRYCWRDYGEDASDDFVLLLGSDKRRLRQRIGELRSESGADDWWRAPKRMVEEEVKGSVNETIGGHLQMGIGTSGGFQVFSVCRPYQVGAPAAYLSYLGLNVSEDFAQVGTCRIGMPGMV